MKDKDDAGQLKIAQSADDREPRKCYHCGRLGHVKLYCLDWLDNTPEGRAHARKTRINDVEDRLRTQVRETKREKPKVPKGG